MNEKHARQASLETSFSVSFTENRWLQIVPRFMHVPSLEIILGMILLVY
jgi:hypothetical protein